MGATCISCEEQKAAGKAKKKKSCFPLLEFIVCMLSDLHCVHFSGVIGLSDY